MAPYPIDEVENKYRFIRHIEKTEKIEIFKANLPASYRLTMDVAELRQLISP